MPAIHIIPILRDNYCFIVADDHKNCVIIDPGQVTPVTGFIAEHGLIPRLILNTHHHADHVAGNAEIKALYDIPVIGPAKESNLIPHMDKGVKEGDVIPHGDLRFNVIETPGHTNGHIVFHVPTLNALFAGDTLFSMGCGRLIEGSAEDMFGSLQKIKSLPEDTLVYCGHEYTESNGRFALSVDPDNASLALRMEDVVRLRANNLPTLPVTIGTELETNPFLRADSAKKFAELRLRKDQF